MQAAALHTVPQAGGNMAVGFPANAIFLADPPLFTGAPGYTITDVRPGAGLVL